MVLGGTGTVGVHHDSDAPARAAGEAALRDERDLGAALGELGGGGDAEDPSAHDGDSDGSAWVAHVLSHLEKMSGLGVVFSDAC